MKGKLILSLLIYFLVCFELAAKTDSPQLLSYSHTDLQSGEMHSLENLKGKPTLMMFFEPQCPWCFKQGKAFNELLRQCPNAINIVALGSNGDKVSLKKELWKMRLHFPGYKAGQTILNDIGQIPATPITLIADEQGHFSSYLRGYVKLDQLLPMLKKQLGLKCT